MSTGIRVCWIVTFLTFNILFISIDNWIVNIIGCCCALAAIYFIASLKLPHTKR